MSKLKFSALFPAVNALLSGNTVANVTDGNETITLTAEQIEASVKADVQPQIEAAVAAAQQEFQAENGASAKDERSRWDEVLSNETCASNIAASKNLLNKTDMSASDIIETVTAMSADSAKGASNNDASNRLQSLNNDSDLQANTGPAGSEAEDLSDFEKRSRDRKARRDAANKEAMAKNPSLRISA